MKAVLRLQWADTEDALSYVAKAVEAKGYKLGDDIVIAMDAAATEFFNEGQYHLQGEGRELSSADMQQMWADLVKITLYVLLKTHLMKMTGLVLHL